MRRIMEVVVAFVIVGFVVHLTIKAWSRRKRAELVVAVRMAATTAGQELRFDTDDELTRRVETGGLKVTVLAVDGGLMFATDEGGGHLGARGFVFCDRPGCSPDAFRAHFGESIVFEPVADQWWSYESTEE